MKFKLSILFLFVIASLSGQEESIDSIAHSAATEGIELREWDGTIDGVHEIELKLDIYQNKCKGEYTLLSSNETFQLEGNIENGDFVLQEIDQNLRISGNLNFQNSLGKSDGIWSHPDRNTFLRISLEPKSLSTSKVSCNQNNWYKKYHGVLDGSNLQVNIIKENNTNLRVDLIIDRIAIEGNATCQDLDCRHFAVTANELSHIYKEFVFKSVTDNKMLLNVVDINGSSQSIRLQPGKELKFNCQSFANYQGRFDIIYPELDHDFFNAFITTQVNDLKDLEEYTEKNENEPENRFQYSSSVWTDIIYYSDKFISGIITKQDNYSGENDRIAFTLDLEKNKVVDIKDFFKKSQQLQQKINSFLHDQKRNYRPLQEQGVAQWIKNENFEQVNLHSKGISLTSSFNNIYGERQLLIPYAEIKNLLKKDFKKEMDID